MRILAVESAAATASVAILEDGVVRGESSINNGKTHSQNLMPMLTALMDTLQLSPEDIDYYAASVGPGSFTGLRIGVSIVKGIAYAVKKPTVAVPTLDAMAMSLIDSATIICPMLDARNNQVFTAVYESKDGALVRHTDYLGIPIETLVEQLESYSNVIFTGDGTLLHQEALTKMKPGGCRFAKGGNHLNSAVDVARVAQTMIENGEVTDAMSLKPFYLRKSQAERMFDLKHGKLSKNG